MSTAESVSLFRQIGGESLWGSRGLLKTNALWLPLAIYLSEAQGRNAPPLVSLLLLFVCVLCWILVSVLGNDLTDCAPDKEAGKGRWICRLPGTAAAAVISAVMGAGVGAVFTAGRARSAAWVYAGALVLGLAYSIRPARLKERGAWGILAYSVSCALAYAVLPGVWLRSDPTSVAILTQAVLLDKWVNLHFHQVIDYQSDAARGTRTYAVRTRLPETGQTLRVFAGLASLGIAAALGYGLWLTPVWRLPAAIAAGGFIAAATAYVTWSRKRPAFKTDLIRLLPLPYLVLSLVVLRLLPVIFLTRLAFESGPLRPVAAACAVLISVELLHLRRYRYA
jgi:4-hydroxybenzoate polyprenyltransferase